MPDAPTSTNNSPIELGNILVTGAAGLVGTNLVRTLLERGYKVRAMDLANSPFDEHENLEYAQGDICDQEFTSNLCENIDTIFHVAAIIDLRSGSAVSKEYRDFVYNVNVGGMQNIYNSAAKHGSKRFIFTSSNSVVIPTVEPKHLCNVDETEPYPTEFSELYTETKVVAEKWILENNNKDGVLTCSIRPSGIWGIGDKTMFRMMFDQMLKGILLARVGSSDIKLDNTYVENLVHGQILAAQNLSATGKAPGQAYFINDNDPINMFTFARPIIEAVGEKHPKITMPYGLVYNSLKAWQYLHVKFKLPEPPIAPVAMVRLGTHNYFSTAKAARELGYQPIYTTDQAMEQCLPYYKDLYRTMKAEAAQT